MSSDTEILDNAFGDIGGLSGLTIFDAGPEGIVSKYLAERIGDGRIIGVNIWLEAYNKIREKVGDKLMGNLVFIKDDMRNINYIKDNFFDLVVCYDTLISIETMTPGATLSILRQFYRILKHGGQFLAIEHPFLKEVKPVNKAQELELEFRKILCQIRHQEFGKGTYRPEQLSEKLKKIGFDGIYWRIVNEGQYAAHEVTSMIKGVRNLANEVKDRKNKEEILEKIKNLAQKAEKSGFCDLPYYALYSRKP